MLPGCVSQGATKGEALDNIRSAIREWLGVEESDPVPEVMEAEVTV
jgi:predicted RNase H-like HicB family nuclease